MLDLFVFKERILAAIARKNNALYSPLSMYIALAMLHRAVESEALEKLGDFGERCVKAALKIPLRLSNSVNWTPDICPSTEYAEILHTLFQASTGEKEMETSQKVVIVNETSLLEKWDRPFETTSEGRFEEEECVYMHDTSDYEYFENDSVQSLRKPLQNGLSVRIVLPKEGVDLERAFDQMTLECYHRYQSVGLAMPKISFDEESHWDQLAEELIGGGLTSFAMKDGSPLVIEDVKITQKSKIKLDEEGVEAEAETTIAVFCLSASSNDDDDWEEPIVMDVNRPFILTVEDRRGTPIFIGVVFKPVAM